MQDTASRSLTLHLLGQFSCTIGTNPVHFVRRRDRDLLTYIALSPVGSVRRSDLLDAFWPGLLRADALQGLRTTLCRLRRAIAISAQGDVERYLRVSDVVSLDLDHVWIDARIFRSCIERADAEDARGNKAAVHALYVKAELLHADELLCSEAHEGPLDAHVAAYRRVAQIVAARLAYGASGDRVRPAIAGLFLLAEHPSSEVLSRRSPIAIPSV